MRAPCEPVERGELRIRADDAGQVLGQERRIASDVLAGAQAQPLDGEVYPTRRRRIGGQRACHLLQERMSGGVFASGVQLFGAAEPQRQPRVAA